MNAETRGVIYVGIAGLCWSFVAIALKMIAPHLSPYAVVWFRFTLSFLLLSGYFLVKAPSNLKILSRPPFFLLIAALFLGINYVSILKGVHLTSPSTTQIFIQTGPLLFAIAGVIVFGERIRPRQLIGFGVAILGYVLFYHRQANDLLVDLQKFNSGLLWVLLAGFCWAVYAVFQKIMVKKYPPNQLNLVIYGLPAVGYLFFVDFSDFQGLSPLSWGLLLFLGLNTLVAYGFLAEGLKLLEANKSFIIITLNPMLTFILMAIFTYVGVDWIEPEFFTPLAYLGAVIVLLGAILVVGSKSSIKK